MSSQGFDARAYIKQEPEEESKQQQDFGSNDQQQEWLRAKLARKSERSGDVASANDQWGQTNDMALDYDGGKFEIETEFGVARVHQGRGAQPMVTTRKDDFGGKSVGSTYPEMIKALRSSKATDAAIAQALLDEDNGPFEDHPQGKNAAAKLMAVTQFAEEARSPSSGKYFRAVLRLVAANRVDLKTAIMEGYVPAKKGGTKAMRDFLSGILSEQELKQFRWDDDGVFSDSSDEELD